jgi:uncharacterized protein with PQ loop repeat
MSDPRAVARSGFAASQGVKRTGKAKFSQGKAVKGKAVKLDKPVLMHFLLFLLWGIILGLVIFIPFYTTASYSRLKVLFAVFFGLGLLFGNWNKNRMMKKIDWAPTAKLFPKFVLTLAVYLALFGGILLTFLLLPMFLSAYTSETTLSISLLLAASPISVFIPFLLNETFNQALEIEPKSYKVWEFPQNYIEKQPTWNHDRLVYSNLSFRRKENENYVTTIKAKLPKEANFGELIYLFIRDYNDNKSPDEPIRQLTEQDGTYGWLFRKYNKDHKGIKKLWTKESVLLDPELTIEGNDMEEDCHIYFERIQNQD